MPKPSKRSEPADEVLDPALARRLEAAMASAELSQADRDSLHDRIMRRIQDDAPPGTVTIRAADMRWVAVGPGVEVKVLRTDLERRDQTVLMRMQPGAVVVGHRHTQEEECWVLEGEIFIADHRLGPGDMHVARPATVHAPIHAPGGALLLIRSEMPPQGLRIA
jgi:anti-sigma factor ChrR (cupin superfamily)